MMTISITTEVFVPQSFCYHSFPHSQDTINLLPVVVDWSPTIVCEWDHTVCQ